MPHHYKGPTRTGVVVDPPSRRGAELREVGAQLPDPALVRLQVANLCRTKIIQRAWERDQPLSVHGWVYGLTDGRVNDLGCTVSRADQMGSIRILPTFSAQE